MTDRQPSTEREANDISGTQADADRSDGGVATAERAEPAAAGDARAESDAITPWGADAASAWAFDPQEQDTADTWAAWTKAGRKAWGDGPASLAAAAEGGATPPGASSDLPPSPRADATVVVASLARHVPVRDMVAGHVGAGLSPLQPPEAREQASADRAAQTALVAPAAGGRAGDGSPTTDPSDSIVAAEKVKRGQAGRAPSTVSVAEGAGAGVVADAEPGEPADAPAPSVEVADAPEPATETPAPDAAVEADIDADDEPLAIPAAEPANESSIGGEEVHVHPDAERAGGESFGEESIAAVTDDEIVVVLPFPAPETASADAATDPDGEPDEVEVATGPAEADVPPASVASSVPSAAAAPAAEAEDADLAADDPDPDADDAAFRDEPSADASDAADIVTPSAHCDEDEEDEAPVPQERSDESYDGEPLAYAADGRPPQASSGGIWTIPLLCAGICIIACCLLIPQTDANRRLAYERDRLRLDLESIRQQMATNEEFLRRIHDDPTLAERLAQRQMKTIRAGTRELPLGQNGAQATEGGMSPFQLVAVQPPPTPPPYTPVGGVIANLCYNPKSRLYLMGLGLTFMAAGLVLGDGTRRA